MPLEQLPEELLLQIASYLPDSGTPRHLKNLSLTSRHLRPIAQESLFTKAKLSICCGCHPKVNALIRLLRTLLDRPDLATKVRTLRFRAVRKGVEKVYAENGFDMPVFRDRCISKLEELGYHSTHPWWRSINNFIESAFGGLLLAVIPNLTEVDFWIKDTQRGPPSSECISGLWGGTSPPDAILYGWRNVKHLVTGDASMLKCGVQFESLTSLDLRTVSIGTVLRLNGPSSLQGAENVEHLALTVSMQFADRNLVNKAEIAFRELLDALACRALRKLKIVFINDGYHIDDPTTELSATYFLNQLASVVKTLETLSITLETTDEDGELDWIIDMFQAPTTSMKTFSALKTLVIPQSFIFDAGSATLSIDNSCMPKDLPPNLEELELLWPHERVEEWVEGFLDDSDNETSGSPPNDADTRSTKIEKLILTCRDDAGMNASYFTECVEEIWWDLFTKRCIDTEARDQMRATKFSLPGLYEEQGLVEEDSDIDDDGINEEDSDYDEDNVYEEDWDDMDEDDWTGSQRELSEFPQQKVDQKTRDQTNVLGCLRDNFHGQIGFTIDELATRLSMDPQRILEAVPDLCDDNHILIVPLPDTWRVRFVKASTDLIRRDITAVPTPKETREHENQTEGDGSCQRQEDAPLSEQRESVDPPADDVSNCRITILRALRDLPIRSVGLTVHSVNTALSDRDPIVVRKAIQDLFLGGFITSDGIQPGSLRTPRLNFVRSSRELRERGALVPMKIINDSPENDDDSVTDDDMPDLEAIEPSADATMGPAVAPLSRCGNVTETAVLRFLRQSGPSQGMRHEEIAHRLGTDFTEILFRTSRLAAKGHVREYRGRIYFVSENLELLKEDVS
ncbi:hypothetical protein OPT61_g5006 [Boeremia exigua]|uniref:Uncharacterized protein n=1 Tax=Boeremia exigua TaxID=749465 RepID=A0ACC2IBW4_9PLEO|nr:hypothetical protein OPT61_g5006 [Boeremia exigua]